MYPNPPYPQNPQFHHPQQLNQPNQTNYAYSPLPQAQSYPVYPQNPQYNHYPPRQLPQQTGYLPPNQYGGIQGGRSQQEEDMIMKQNEKRKLERSIKIGFLKCYYFWNWFCLYSFGLNILRSVFSIIFFPSASTFIQVGLAIWNCTQSALIIKAIRNLNLKKATIALWLMVIEIFFLVLIFIQIANARANFQPSSSKDNLDVLWKLLLDCGMVVIPISLIIHLAVNINGAVQLKNILVKLEAIQMSLPNYNP